MQLAIPLFTAIVLVIGYLFWRRGRLERDFRKFLWHHDMQARTGSPVVNPFVYDDLTALHTYDGVLPNGRPAVLLLGTRQRAGTGSDFTSDHYAAVWLPPSSARDITDAWLQEWQRKVQERGDGWARHSGLTGDAPKRGLMGPPDHLPVRAVRTDDGGVLIAWRSLHLAVPLQERFDDLENSLTDLEVQPRPVPAPASAPHPIAPNPAQNGIASPSSQSAAPGQRFHFIGTYPVTEGPPVWAGGFLLALQKPDREELHNRFLAEAQSQLQRREPAGEINGQITIVHLYELPAVPRPAEGDLRPAKYWLISIGIVCHDIKFGTDIRAVLAWPEEPAGTVLESMQQLLICDTIALRGDHPDYADTTDILTCTVVPDAGPATPRYQYGW